MRRLIARFRPDGAGGWVADLSCLHSQHVRHRPPFQDRAWVLTEDGREGRLGTEIECPLCDRAELPDGLQVERVAGPYDATTLPDGLRRAHRVPEGAWGRLVVTEGRARLSIETEPPIDVELCAGESQAIPPGVSHAVAVDGPVQLVVEFLSPS